MARKPNKPQQTTPPSVNAPAPQGQGPRNADGVPLVKGAPVPTHPAAASDGGEQEGPATAAVK